MKKIRHILAALIISISVIAGSALPAFAAPRVMNDGGVFDPEFYAANNPDVVAALGSDGETLYSHYKSNGKNEGRKPYADGTNPNQVIAEYNANIQFLSKYQRMEPDIYLESGKYTNFDNTYGRLTLCTPLSLYIDGDEYIRLSNDADLGVGYPVYGHEEPTFYAFVIPTTTRSFTVLGVSKYDSGITTTINMYKYSN